MVNKVKFFSLYAACALGLTFFVGCGKSECKKYTALFCADEKNPACLAAREKVKNWSSDQCRIEHNKIRIDEQSKRLDDELK
ncbi:MAG: hypothetical protein JSR44_05315 [Spirochaetes bacterium]|nr:hypothetical protein [Spirochaetota bacterium]